MDRRTLAGGLGGLALVIAAVVALRIGDAPDTLRREIDENVEVVQQLDPMKPANPRAQALDADALQIAWNGSASAYEVRWYGNEQLVPGPEVELSPVIDLEAGYVLRSLDELPKQGARAPWRLRQNYPYDVATLRWGSIETGMEFSPAPATAPAPVATA